MAAWEARLFVASRGDAKAYRAGVAAKRAACRHTNSGSGRRGASPSFLVAMERCRDALRLLATVPQGEGIDDLRREFVRLAGLQVGDENAARLLLSRLDAPLAAACAHYGTDLVGLVQADAAPFGFLRREAALREKTFPVPLDLRIQTAVEDGWEMDAERRARLAKFLASASVCEKRALLSRLHVN